MGQRKQPNFRARQLGRTLYRLRKQAGRTQHEVAKRLRVAPAKISRIESGQVPIYAEFELLLDIYGIPVPDWDEYLRMYERAREKGWWHAYGLDDKGFVSLEAEASTSRDFALGYIPGLLQTEAYIRAIFAGARRPLTGDRLEKQVAVRLRRQWRLTDEPHLRLHAIVDETALRHQVLKPPEHRAQLGHLVERAKLATVTLQVIPRSRGAHSGRDGSFTVLSYADLAEDDIAYVEHGFGAIQAEDGDEVRAARLAFDHLADIALNQVDSIALIEAVAVEV